MIDDRPVVVLSVAHVGDGGVRLPDGRNEWDYSRAVVARCADYLIACRASCVVEVVEAPLVARPGVQSKVQKINSIEGAACVVEPHLNASRDFPHVGGSMAIYAPGSKHGQALATRLLEALHHVSPPTSTGHRRLGPRAVGDAWVNRKRLPLVQDTKPPAVIVEPGFVTHAGDAAWLMRSGAETQIARALGGGILRWLTDRGMLSDFAGQCSAEQVAIDDEEGMA